MIKKLNTETNASFGDIGATCSPQNTRFMGYKPDKVDEFFSVCKTPEQNSSGKDIWPRVSSVILYQTTYTTLSL